MFVTLFPPKQSLKNLILNILLQHSESLTVNEIKKRIKTQYGKTISYQGIYKILLLFEKEAIVAIENKKWILEKQWLLSIKNTIQKYETSTNISSYKEGVKSVTMQTIGEAFNFFIDYLQSKEQENQMKIKSKNKDKPLFVCHLKNIGLLVPHHGERLFIQKFAEQNDCHILIENKNFVNIFCAKFLKDCGMNVYFNVPRSTPQIIILHDDELINVFFDFDIIFYLTQKYKQIKLFSKPKQLHFFDSIKNKKKGKIVFTFETETTVVERIRKHFKEIIAEKKAYKLQ